MKQGEINYSSKTIENNSYICLGENCILDIKMEEIIKENWHIPLSQTQFRLLFYLAKNMGRTVKHEELTSFVWGKEAFINRNNLYVNIKRLRERLEDNPKNPKCLMSINRIGYILYPKKKKTSQPEKE